MEQFHRENYNTETDNKNRISKQYDQTKNYAYEEFYLRRLT